MKRDLYRTVTYTIIRDLERGVRPWVQPWASGDAVFRPLRITGEPHRGINTLMLWRAAQKQGYGAANWMTYKQAEALGAHVRKGEQGTTVVYFGTLARPETDLETGEEGERAIPFLKGYSVFNVEQIEGLPAEFSMQPAAMQPETERI